MRVPKSVSLFAWTVLVALAAAQAPERKVGELDGKWVGVGLENGNESFPEVAKRFKLGISEGKLTLYDGQGGSGGGTVQIDPTQTPKHIQWKAMLRAGGGTGRSAIVGIYELKGDTLRICYNTIDKDKSRPMEFKTRGKGAGRFLLTLKRAK